MTPNSIITTIAGGAATFQDGVPATQSSLRLDQDPTGQGIAVGRDGTVFVVDANDFGRVRRIGTDGIITTAAGAGNVNPPNFGDGGRAVDARVVGPRDVAVDPQGNLLIAAEGRVRKVTPDGIITTVAGSPPNQGDSTSEGIPATQARVGAHALVALADGGFFLAEDDFSTPAANFRVRHVDAQGIIRTVAGLGGARGFSGDGGPPLQARLDSVFQLGLSPDARLHVVDNGNQRVRAIGSTLPGFSAANLEVTSEDGRELYRFDEFGRHLATQDTFTGASVYTFGYDTDGQLASVADAAGNVTKTLRAAGGAPTAIVAPFGQRTSLTAGVGGALASLREPAGGTWLFESTPEGLLIKETDPLGQVHEFSYDDAGRLVRDDGPGALTADFARTLLAAGYFVTETNAAGDARKYQIERLADGTELRTNTDAAGLVTTEAQGPDGKITLTTPDRTVRTLTLGPDARFGMRAPAARSRTLTTPGGKVLTESLARNVTLTNPLDPLSLAAFSETRTRNGKVSTLTYDPATRTFEYTTPLGRKATRTLDAAGRTVRLRLADLAPVEFVLDSRGRLLSQTRGTGANARVTTHSYNAAGFPATTTRPGLGPVKRAFNANGGVTKLTVATGGMISLELNLLGFPRAIMPPGREAHRFTYTAFGLEASYTAPAVGGVAPVTTREYRADGQIAQVTRPGGETIVFNYDAAGRVATRTVAAGETAYSYDAATGALSTITAPGGSALAFAYDGPARLSATWSGPVAGSVSRTIDDELRTATQSVNGGSTVAFGYDDDGLLASAGALTLTRDAVRGQVTQSDLGLVRRTAQYNEFGAPVSATVAFNGGTVFAQQFTYDRLGRGATKTETIGGVTDTFAYTYGDGIQLSEVKKNGVIVESYGYDANGNRTVANGTTASYDAQDRLVAFGATTFTYNAAGDLESRTAGGATTLFTYDALGQLNAAALAGGPTVEYLHDGQGRRIGRKVNGALDRGFLYEDALRVVAELDGSGALVSRFVHTGSRTVPAYMIRGGAAYRLITDPLGSVRLVVDAATGSIAQRMDYDAFGRVTLDTNPGFQPFGFAGGLYDPTTKLVRFGARDYDADTGRWTSQDPIKFRGGGTNLYAYVTNDPVNRVDPTGLRPGKPKPPRDAYQRDPLYRLDLTPLELMDCQFLEYRRRHPHGPPVCPIPQRDGGRGLDRTGSSDSPPGSQPGDHYIYEDIAENERVFQETLEWISEHCDPQLADQIDSPGSQAGDFGSGFSETPFPPESFAPLD